MSHAIAKHLRILSVTHSQDTSPKLILSVWARLIFVSAFLVIVFFATIASASAQEAAPTLVPSYKVFSSGPQAVTISDTDGSAVLHMTTDGSVPTSSSPIYTGSFNVSATTTVKAIAIGASGTSAV
jgi:cytoskeletal protein RodZ